MNFDRANAVNSGIPLPELYSILSSEGIRTTEFKTGVLLHMRTPGFRSYLYNPCLETLARVHATGGYIVHDEDDVILAQWLEENIQLSDAISQAVQCALKILDECNVQRIAHSRKPRVKIAISAGRFSRVRVGDEEHQICVVFGPAVEDIRSAEALVEPGKIILSPEAWRLCDRENLTIEPIENQEAVTVRCIRQQQSVSVEDLDIPERRYQRIAYLIKNVERENFIRIYMMQTALQKIYETGRGEHLQEIWPATVMFVNLQYAQTLMDLRGSCHKVSEIIAEQMFSCRAEICNIFFFEEGCIFLGVVGLPEDKRQDKAAVALQAAYRIHELCLQEISSLSTVSVGVTTGRVLYSLEQLPLNKKYTAYGHIVNLAAKLTTDYPGIVSCDVATKLYSMLPLSCLIPQVTRSQYDGVRYQDEINQMLADEAAMCSGMDGRRLALAHMQTMLLFERMVVKYASAIGHTFTTEMLQNILPYLSKLDLPVTLRSLFKGGVFKCASKPRNSSSTKTCYCENSPEGEYTWVSADPVWTCRLMSFCNKDEMEMVHKLIQANEYLFRMIHIKCANYLEKKAYRCSKCNNDKFIFGHTVATGNSNRNNNSSSSSSEYLQEIYKSIRPYEIFQQQGTHLRNQMCPAEENGNNTENFLAKVNSIVTEARDRTSSCECAQLVETVLIPRVRHWRCAGDVPRTFYYLVESAAACDFLQNDARALEFSNEARSILENLNAGKPAFTSADRGDVQICKFQQACMHRLTGEILFKAGNILEAEENFKKALKLLNCSLPRNSVAQSLKFIYEKMKKLHYRSRQFEIADRRKLARLQECVDCLSFLWQISYMRGQLKSASLAITMEINLAIQSADTFKILYSAIDCLKYSQLVAEESECRRLEAFLCTTCASLPDYPEGRRLISRLTQTLAVVKLCTGDLEQSIACTIRAQQLNEVLNRPGLDARTTAALHLPLLLTYRYRESVQQILILENLSKEISSSVAKGWFYAACMNFLLYAGFALRPFEECLAFVEESRSDAILEADKSLMMHLYSAVALWYTRLENWEKCAVFYDKACEVYAQIPTTIESISGVVMLLECSVLLFRKKLTECNSQRRISLKRTRKLFSDFTQRFGRNHIFGPRVLHLNAYLHHLAGSNTLMQDHLNEALLLCEKQGNLLDQKWIRQSQADWSGACSDTPAAECPTAVLSMPSWDEAAILQPEELLKYCFHLKKQKGGGLPIH